MGTGFSQGQSGRSVPLTTHQV